MMDFLLALSFPLLQLTGLVLVGWVFRVDRKAK